MLPKRFIPIVDRLPHIAEKSMMLKRHAAVMVKNGIPVSWGYNTYDGAGSNHAEANAISRFLIGLGLEYREKQKPCILRKEST